MSANRQRRETSPQQRRRILQLLRDAQAEGRLVTAADFVEAGLPHYDARICELFDRGIFIVEEQEEDDDGAICQGFKILSSRGFVL